MEINELLGLLGSGGAGAGMVIFVYLRIIAFRLDELREGVARLEKNAWNRDSQLIHHEVRIKTLESKNV